LGAGSRFEFEGGPFIGEKRGKGGGAQRKRDINVDIVQLAGGEDARNWEETYSNKIREGKEGQLKEGGGKRGVGPVIL